jgi:hypothetical protein
VLCQEVWVPRRLLAGPSKVVVQPGSSRAQRGSNRSEGSSDAFGSAQSGPHWWRTSASHQAITLAVRLIAGTRCGFGPRPWAPSSNRAVAVVVNQDAHRHHEASDAA